MKFIFRFDTLVYVVAFSVSDVSDVQGMLLRALLVQQGVFVPGPVEPKGAPQRRHGYPESGRPSLAHAFAGGRAGLLGLLGATRPGF